MEKEGFGEEFSICSSFCFGEIRGGQKTEKTNSILCLYHSTIFRPRSKGVHPRHSPRTFPLGLLAPRCLGFLLILAIPALRSGGEGRRLFGGRKESFPQLRLVSAGLDQPAQPTPFLVFNITFVVSLSLLDFSIARVQYNALRSFARPRPIAHTFSKKSRAKQKRMEKRWGEGGTPSLCEALAELSALARNRSV